MTLVCEDGQQLEAHKVILAFSSPFFQKILQNSKHPHPLIYLRGFRSKDLLSILDFLYFGEANVYQEDLDSFLAIAEEIQLKGLTGQTQSDTTKEEQKPQIFETNGCSSELFPSVPFVVFLPSNHKRFAQSGPSTESPLQGQGRNPNLLGKHLPHQSRENQGWTESPLNGIP